MSKKTIKPYPFVSVTWIDSSSRYGWVSLDEADGDLLDGFDHIKTVGFLIAQAKDGIVIANSIGGLGNCDAPMAIPACAIQLMTYHPELDYKGNPPAEEERGLTVTPRHEALLVRL